MSAESHYRWWVRPRRQVVHHPEHGTGDEHRRGCATIRHCGADACISDVNTSAPHPRCVGFRKALLDGWGSPGATRGAKVLAKNAFAPFPHHATWLQSGGSAEVSSSEGHGTTVTLRFPQVKALPVCDMAVHAQTNGSANGHSRTEVMVVEDDIAVRQGIAEVLRLLNFSVREACDGESGLRELRRRMPDLLMPTTSCRA